MRNPLNTFQAGIAALALLAGTGWAAAQNATTDQNASSKMHQGHAGTQSMNKTGGNAQPGGGKMGQNTQSQSMKMNKTGTNAQANTGKMGQNTQGQSMKMGQNTQGQKQTSTKYTERTGKAGGKSAQYQGHKGRTAQLEKRHAHMMTQRESYGHRHMMTQREGYKGARIAEHQRGTYKGLQGNAGVQSRENVTLNEQQRTTIRNTVLDASGAPRVGQVNFDVRVGTVIPRTGIRIMPVPETLVRIEPRWRGLRYFIYEQEIVIVNPRDMRIVAVLPV